MFKGETIAFPLVEFLNGCSESDVHLIVRACSRLDEMADGLAGCPRGKEELQRWNNYRKLATDINARLTKYTASPSIEINEPIHEIHGEDRKLYQERGPYFLARAFHNKDIPQNSLAGIALLKQFRPILALEEIIDQGLIGRLRRCDIDDCGKYFFAKNTLQLFCPSPSTCRQRKYDRSPKTKARRKRTLALHKSKIFKSRK